MYLARPLCSLFSRTQISEPLTSQHRRFIKYLMSFVNLDIRLRCLPKNTMQLRKQIRHTPEHQSSITRSKLTWYVFADVYFRRHRNRSKKYFSHSIIFTEPLLLRKGGEATRGIKGAAFATRNQQVLPTILTITNQPTLPSSTLTRLHTMSSFDVVYSEDTYCTLCDMYFPTHASRREHIQSSRYHPICEKCDRRFLNLNSLRSVSSSPLPLLSYLN